MLDNLVNANLAGLTGNINYTYDSYAMMLPGLIGMILFFCTIWIVLSYFENRKTYNYRKKLMDLYVAGTIRKLAKADEIDLDEEYKEFVRREKKMKNQWKELDEVVEDTLKDNVKEENEKSLKESKK